MTLEACFGGSGVLEAFQEKFRLLENVLEPGQSGEQQQAKIKEESFLPIADLVHPEDSVCQQDRKGDAKVLDQILLQLCAPEMK